MVLAALAIAVMGQGSADEEEVVGLILSHDKYEKAMDWEERGDTLFDENKLDEALQAYDAAFRLYSEWADSWKRRGNALADQGKYFEAVAAYLEAKSVYEKIDEGKLLYSKRNILIKQGKDDEAALTLYDEEARLYSEWADVCEKGGDANLNLGRYHLAELDYNESSKYYDNLAFLLRENGYILTKQGKYDEALQAYDKADWTNLEVADSLKKEGDVLRYRGNDDEASKIYDKAIQAYDNIIYIHPDNVTARYSKGLVLRDQGNYTGAIQAFNEIIELGKPDEAYQALGEIIKIEPDDAEGWYQKGLALKEQGKYEEAIEALNESLKLNPKEPRAWALKVEALEALGRTSEAEAASTTFKSLDMEVDVNRIGEDYLDFTLTYPDPALCKEACANDEHCKACTYVKPGYQGPDARCWLKDEVPPPTPGKCCISWVKSPEQRYADRISA